MAKTLKLETKGKEIGTAIETLLSALLEMEEISAVLVPRRLPMKNTVMPTLITQPDHLQGVDPLSPAFPLNGAKILSRLTRKPFPGKVAAVMRPCEIRAFIELVKLNQGSFENLIIIGSDCLGAFSNTDYLKWGEENPVPTSREYIEATIKGAGTEAGDRHLATACRACEQPVPHHADILIGLFGVDPADHLLLQAQTPAGEEITGRLNLQEMPAPAERRTRIEALIRARTAYRDAMFERTREAIDSIEKLTAYLAGCVNCYNCRVACPVCYCKECVFVTDVFCHDPSQYLNWAERKGAIKMPTDTVFYHLTRLAHMSTACVGCGQCSNACPNGIPVMELFRLVADRTQKGFGYAAGRDLEEKPPLSEFREHELEEVVGIG
jgi:formate dehydrogenase (coenzyme F420) beta subunit